MPAIATPCAEPEQGAGTTYLYAISLVAAVGGFLFGYDLSLISGAIIFLKLEFALTPFWFGMVASSAILGCPFGSLSGVWLADKVGRKRTLGFAGLLFVVSSIGCALAGGKIPFILWRFAGGAGVGLASTISPMYIAEVAPAHRRGRLVMVFQLAVGIGLSMSVYVTYLLSFGGHWRWMFVSQIAPVLGLLLGLLFVPESPRWLAATGRVKEALGVLMKINGRQRAETELQEIETELNEEAGGFRELLLPGVRLALIIGIALMVFSQINGVNMIGLYTPTLLMEAGLSNPSNAILNSVYLCGWSLVWTLVAFWLIRKFSRRSILVVGAIAIVAGHLLLYTAYARHLSPRFILAAMMVPVAAYVLSLGPLSWVVLSEMFPNRVRAKAMSLSTCAMFAASYITTLSFPSVMDWFKGRFGQPGGAFLIFAGICAVGVLFLWKMLPETKDKTLEEIGLFWLKLDRDRRKPGGPE